MILLLLLIPLAGCQHLYGISQLDQYARLWNSGNLGGFGMLQKALEQGRLRGIEDLGGVGRLAGLPPLPLTHDEVMRQLTSTTPAPTTRPTAAPTPAPTGPPLFFAGYAVNPIPEMPPMPEDRIHGTYDADGKFHSNVQERKEELSQIDRNKIQGTKIRDFSDPDKGRGRRVVVPVKKHESTEDYEADEFYDDSDLRLAPVVEAQRLRQQVIDRPRVRVSDQTAFHRPTHLSSSARIQAAPKNLPREWRQVRQPQPKPQPTRPPPFVFRPKPPPQNREQMYNNILAEIEEYDDFLDQQQSYYQRYPGTQLQNPYRDLPPGQLPSATQVQQTTNLAAPQRPQFADPRVVQQQTQWQQPSNPVPAQAAAQQFANQQQSDSHPLLRIFDIFHPVHAHAHAAPQLQAQPIQLVDINQQPVVFPQLGSPLVLNSFLGKK